MWTTSCLRTTPLLTASWTSGGRQAVRGWVTCTGGTRSTQTSPWASGQRWLPSTNPHRWDIPTRVSALIEVPCAYPSGNEWSPHWALVLMQFFSAGFQNATQNCLELLEDPKAAAVDEIAAKLGMCKVGSSLLMLFFDFVLLSCLHVVRNVCVCVWKRCTCASRKFSIRLEFQVGSLPERLKAPVWHQGGPQQHLN